MTLAAAVEAEQGIPKVPVAAWGATLMLAFLYWLSVLDRFIISLLVDPIKRDLGLTDVQFGMLHGLAFLLTYTLFGLVFGALADRASRRWIIYVGVSVWSIATALCGFAQNFWHLLLARVGVGAGEAALNPCATSMISDLFPRERLTSAMAVYSIGATVGGGTALIVGGAIVHWIVSMGELSLPIIGEVRPWQMVFLVVGVPGALLALSVFSIPEPGIRRRRPPERSDRPWYAAYVALFKFMKSRLRFFLCHYIGFTLAGAVVIGNASWLPVHMGRAFGWSAGRVGVALGMTLMVAGIVGKLLCGRLVDAMYRRGYRDAQLRWYAVCLLVATPLGLIALTSDDPEVFLLAIGAFTVLIIPMPACAMAALNLVTPNELRGTGVAAWTTLSGLLGGGAGPLMIAAVSEHGFGGAGTVGLGMAVLIATCCPLAAACLFLGLRGMREAMADIESRSRPRAV